MSAGLSALIRIGAELEHEFASIEVIEIGRPATGPEQDFTMQVCGRWLFYTVALYPADPPERPADGYRRGAGSLLRDRDNENGWQTARGVIAALERSEIKSLERPMERRGRSRRCQRLGDRMKAKPPKPKPRKAAGRKRESRTARSRRRPRDLTGCRPAILTTNVGEWIGEAR
jgi:hypothetical protein